MHRDNAAMSVGVISTKSIANPLSLGTIATGRIVYHHNRTSFCGSIPQRADDFIQRVSFKTR